MLNHIRYSRLLDTCQAQANTLLPRTILVAPPAQSLLTYSNDIYVCDETLTRFEEMIRTCLQFKFEICL
jgi:hypothetical protein